MINITDFQKKIYNCYLKNFRKGEPYKLRKDFSNVHPNVLASVHKISNFLTTYNHINVEEYFEAPHFLHPDEKYPSLNFFTSRAALKNYALYQKQKEDRNPELQFDEIKNSYRFIGMFCVGSKIELEKYLTYKAGYTYAWLNHYREHKINPYCLFELGDVFGILERVPKDELYLFAENLQTNLVAFNNRYHKSPKTKQYTKEIVTKIKEFVKKELTQP
jgi:hypothetical protein